MPWPAAHSQGLITTLLFVAQQPTAIVPLLAKSLPLTSRFYVTSRQEAK